MIIPSGFGQVNLRFSGDIIPTGAEVTFGIDVALVDDTPAEMAELIRQRLLTANIAQNYVNNVTLSSILVKYGPNDIGPSGIVAAAIQGSKTGDNVAANTACLVNKNTAFGGRAGKGRMYWPGMSAEDIDDSNLLSSAFATAFATALNNFRTAMATADVGLVLLHDAGSPLTIPTPITSFTVQRLVATQRRRLRR